LILIIRNNEDRIKSIEIKDRRSKKSALIRAISVIRVLSLKIKSNQSKYLPSSVFRLPSSIFDLFRHLFLQNTAKPCNIHLICSLLGIIYYIWFNKKTYNTNGDFFHSISTYN
jgi:hypothetical protein